MSIKSSTNRVLTALGALFFSFLPYTSLSAISGRLEPVMVIDCGKNNTLFSASCFKQVILASEKMVESGKFEKVVSLATLPFAVNSGGVKPVVLELSSLYGKNPLVARLKKIYPVEFSLLADKNERYTIFYASPGSNGDPVLTEINDILERIGFGVLTHSENGFFDYYKNHFLQYGGTVEIKLSDELIEQPESFIRQLGEISDSLYQVKGIKQLYSPLHIISEMEQLFYGGVSKVLTPARWETLMQLWDLTSEYRSCYFDQVEGVLYLSVYIDGGAAGEPYSSIMDNIKSLLSALSAGPLASGVRFIAAKSGE